MRCTTTILAATVAGALGLTAASAATAAPTGQFGIEPGSFTLTATGTPTPAAAGGHPDLTIRFALAPRDPEGDATRPPGSTYGPAGTIKDGDTLLPRGFVANPQAASVCAFADVLASACKPESGVGQANFSLYVPPSSPDPGVTVFENVNALLSRVQPNPGEVAAFGAQVLQNPVRFGVSVGPDGGYRVRAQLRNVSEAYALARATITLWGIPADHQGPPTDPDSVDSFGGPLRDVDGNLAPRRAFTAMSTSCDGQPGRTSFSVLSWQERRMLPPVFTDLAPVTGCGDVPFDPSITVASSSHRAGAPAGYDVDVRVPQPWTDPVGPDQTPVAATAHLKDATVALPEGVAISPSAASGLGACTDEELAIDASTDEACPATSRIGTVSLESPLLDAPVEGRIYLGSQQSQDPQSGKMYRIFLTATAQGVKVKLRGAIRADPRTGQLTTTFEDNPQLPFSRLTLRFKDGERAPLVNPPTCGTKTTAATVSSWAGQSRQLSSSFAITEGCPSGRFVPGFTAGTLNPLAGGLSPFTVSIARSDGDQDLSRIRLDLPSGLLGALGSVTVCSDARAAAGTCGAESRLGSTTVAVGTGSLPYTLPGSVSLGGPYKGAPFSLSIAVRAKAGPFDLGQVVVRSPLIIDAAKATVSAPVDDLPQIVGGVPLHYRSINVTLDRPGFMFNATSCRAQAIGATIGAVGGATQAAHAPYQAQGCNKLSLRPRLELAYAGRTQLRKGSHPGIEADLYDTFGQANLKTVAVKLPLTAALDPDNARALCEATDAAAGHCPDASIIGRASASTPALHAPVTGPVYFVKGTRVGPGGRIIKTLPKLFLKLSGEGVSIDLHADSAAVGPPGKQNLVTTFVNLPDVPIRNFHLSIDGGAHGIIEATNDVCGAAKATTATFVGQNEGRTHQSMRFAAPDCKPQIVSATGSASALAVRVGGIGAGRVTVTGPAIGRVTRRIASSDVATLRPRLSTATRAQLRRGRSARVAVRVAFAPTKGKAVTLHRTVTVRGTKARTR